MSEHAGAVTFKGQPLTLIGNPVKVGENAPDSTVVDQDLKPVKLSTYKGKVCIICSVPSLDTPVCDLETRRFNEEAGKLGTDVNVLTISMDLPFAQKRWCGAAHANHVKTFSDYRDANFGKAYGVLIKELHLLGRAVFVVDAKGVVRAVHYVKEMTDQPNYEQILNEVQQIKKS